MEYYGTTCCNKDCPKTDDKIIRALCEFHYPFGNRNRCKKMFKKWLEDDERIQKIHKEYLEKGEK